MFFFLFSWWPWSMFIFFFWHRYPDFFIYGERKSNSGHDEYSTIKMKISIHIYNILIYLFNGYINDMKFSLIITSYYEDFFFCTYAMMINLLASFLFTYFSGFNFSKHKLHFLSIILIIFLLCFTDNWIHG